MELISGSQLEVATNLSAPTIMKYVNLGKIPFTLDDNGRRRFNLEQVQEAMGRHGIKGRSRKAESEADHQAEEEIALAEGEEADDTQLASDDAAVGEPTPEIPAEAQAVIARAFRRAERAFKRHIAQAIETTSFEPEHELMLLRLHVKADQVFETVSRELLA